MAMTRFYWYPTKDLVESTNVKRVMDELGLETYRKFVEKSVEELEWFWDIVNEYLNVEWFEDYSQVLDMSDGIMWAKWYRGGLINVAHNALDRHAGPKEDDLAFIWCGEDGTDIKYSYGKLRSEVDKLAYSLMNIGVKKGDVVALYIPMLPETVVSLFAILKIGAVAMPIFSGFGPEAVALRLNDSGAKVMITVDGYLRRGRELNLKQKADEALVKAPGIEKVIVVQRLGIEVNMERGRDIYYGDFVSGNNVSVNSVPMDPEDPALLLYTSGTTGRPKGAVISHAGALLQPAKEHFFNLDMKVGDVLFWISDIGWMMGPWQIIGAQHHGFSHLIMEGAPDYPSPDRIWSIVEEHKVTQLGFSATLIRLLRKYGDEYVEMHDLSSLKAFGNTGEPIDEASWFWLIDKVGEKRAPIINLSGGTEIFGCFVLPSPIMPLKPTTLGYNGLGMATDVVDDKGNPVRGEVGYLVCRKPAPSMTRGLWGDPERYIRTYWSRFEGMWFHGDWAMIDEDGYFYILGRADDVIKVAGKRVGPAEIETIINKHPAVAESAVIGAPHELKGETIVAFVVLKEGYEASKDIEKSILNSVVESIGKPFKPEKIYFVPDLPRTRSGKIMRRLVKAIYLGKKDIGDVSTLENPGAIEGIKATLGLEEKN